MSKNKSTKNELKQMSKEKLLKQLEFYQRDLEIAVARALKYYTAYNYVMEHFDSLDNEDKQKVHKRLNEIGL